MLRARENGLDVCAGVLELDTLPGKVMKNANGKPAIDTPESLKKKLLFRIILSSLNDIRVSIQIPDLHNCIFIAYNRDTCQTRFNYFNIYSRA